MYKLILIVIIFLNLSCASATSESQDGDMVEKTSDVANSATSLCVENYKAASVIAKALAGNEINDFEFSEEFQNEIKVYYPNLEGYVFRITPSLDEVKAKLGINGFDYSCAANGKFIHCDANAEKMWPLYTENARKTFNIPNRYYSKEEFIIAQSVVIHELDHTNEFMDGDDFNFTRIRDWCYWDKDSGVDRYKFAVSEISHLDNTTPETHAEIMENSYRCIKGLEPNSNDIENAGCEAILELVRR